LKQEKRGLGFFGDDNEKVKEHDQKRQEEMSMRVPPMESITDEKGRVAFSGLPIGLYEISVSFS
jgi:hypothetical protein